MSSKDVFNDSLIEKFWGETTFIHVLYEKQIHRLHVYHCFSLYSSLYLQCIALYHYIYFHFFFKFTGGCKPHNFPSRKWYL